MGDIGWSFSKFSSAARNVFKYVGCREKTTDLSGKIYTFTAYRDDLMNSEIPQSADEVEANQLSAILTQDSMVQLGNKMIEMNPANESIGAGV